MTETNPNSMDVSLRKPENTNQIKLFKEPNSLKHKISSIDLLKIIKKNKIILIIIISSVLLLVLLLNINNIAKLFKKKKKNLLKY